MAVVDNPTVVWRPMSREPPWISAQTLYWQKLESIIYTRLRFNFLILALYKFTYLLTYLLTFDADSMALCSFKFSWLAPTMHVSCNKVCNDRLRSSKVVDFGTNRKRICNFLLGINITCSTLAPFLRYGNLLAENGEFFLPHSHLTPSLGKNSFEFLDELFIAKTRVLGPSVGEDFILLYVVLAQYQRVTERRTDNSTVFCIASCADAL